MRENLELLRWLDTAVSGIRFYVDRAEVRKELEDHIEDKTADLMRIFPDMTEEEAQTRALSGMGDPEEVKKELAKVHKPWLGRLWMVSRFVLGILLAFALMAASISDEPWENQLVGHMPGYSRTEFGAPDQPEPARAELGGYTFQIIDAAYREGEIYDDDIQVIFRVSTPKFWERIDWFAVKKALTVTAPDGTVYPMDSPIDLEALNRGEYLISMTLCRWDIFYRDFSVTLDGRYAEDWSPGDRVTLDFDFPKGSFTLSAGVTERMVWK